jgi:hypothetical protein
VQAAVRSGMARIESSPAHVHMHAM